MPSDIVKSDQVQPSVKPGWRSSEFWGVTVAWILSALLASGVLPDGGAAVKVASFIAAALASVGYAAGRSYVKGK